MKIGAHLARTALLGTVVALAGCGGAGSGETPPAATTAGAPAAATPATTVAPRASASPGEGYKDDYGY